MNKTIYNIPIYTLEYLCIHCGCSNRVKANYGFKCQKCAKRNNMHSKAFKEKNPR